MGSSSDVAAIDAQGLWKTHRNGKVALDVLRGVSIKVRRSEIVAILGPSGAGKTTLLNLLSGLDQPTQGTVTVADRVMTGMNAGERARFLNKNIGFVFQFYHLLADLTAFENVMLPSLVRRTEPMAQIRQRAQALLSEIGLGQRLAHFPSELSGGEQQRVAIARAVMNDPKILFCDEPTGNLDSVTGAVVCEYLKRLSTEFHKTILIVTHDDKIARMANQVIHLKDGRRLDA